MVITLFLPWTQNINTKGYVTSRSPEQRTQSIQSVIAGKIDKWYVKEGDFVAKGDTIVFISEVKTEYFDPNILERTSEQIAAKSQSIEAYDQKVIALNNQYKAMKEGLNLKREQIRNKIIQGKNKIKMDSIDLTALKTNIQITNNQLDRTKELYDKGLKSLTELQEKEYKVQEETAKVNVQVNKLINQKNEVINLEIELAAIEQEYADKMSKSISEMQTAVSSKLESIAATAKLQNQLSNYSERQKYYYIIAPQSGYITKTIKKGIGEIIKEGDDVTTIVPSNYDLAVELYVRPQDIPLLKIGGPVNLRFDGWPAIVISGWPESSSGVFTGNVVAIDRFISTNGNYRVLVSPEEDTKAWPEFLSFGTGVRAFILLNKVPVWYEIWRQLNGFPPNFYDTNNKATNDELKRKAPIKSVK
ncbi:MAG: HlyD family efflux transporter periplasmic adaptor subunit [Chitinophagales bacterium]